MASRKITRRKLNKSKPTHGQTYTPEFRAWTNMLQRCYNPKNPRFNRYGARGIIVCDAWHVFANFLGSMGPKPVSGLTLERKDNNGNYEPDNCHWATRKQQQRNMSRNHTLTFAGVTLPVAGWADRIGMPVKVLHGRVRRGWTTERALTQPRQPHRRAAAKRSER